MPLKKEYVRDGRNQIIGSVTSGYLIDSEVVRDADNKSRVVPATCSNDSGSQRLRHLCELL